MSSAAALSSYWCYRCSQFIWVHDSVACPSCGGGFIEAIDSPPQSNVGDPGHRRLPSSAIHRIGSRADSHNSLVPGTRRNRRNGGDRSPFNPVIVLRRPSDGDDGGDGNGYELYYDDGGGSGLRPLPPSISEFLLGSGIDRLLGYLQQVEISGIGRLEQAPASKAAIESMPIVEICKDHVESEELHCAICKELFEVDSRAREMPCKHLYHQDCILPWLSMRNSCPVCRHEMPPENQPELTTGIGDEEIVGMTIWRLPGGGFAVGRFSGGRRGSEGELLPVVYTEMDGGFNNSGAGGGGGGGGGPRRISWPSRGSRGGRETGGLRRLFSNLFGCFGGRSRSSSSAASSSSSRMVESGSYSASSSTFRRPQRPVESDILEHEGRR